MVPEGRGRGVTHWRLRECYFNPVVSCDCIGSPANNSPSCGPPCGMENKQVMQDSLGGNAKTLMFVNISPADYNQDETVTALTYATRVKLITNTAEKQQVGNRSSPARCHPCTLSCIESVRRITNEHRRDWMVVFHACHFREHVDY